MSQTQKPEPAIEQQVRQRKSRSWAIFLSLLVFVLLVYGITIVKIKLGYGP